MFTVPIAILIGIAIAPALPPQESGRKLSPVSRHAEILAAGTKVVFVADGTQTDASERLARTAFPPPYVVERVDGDRVLISTRRGKRQRWTSRSQVVSFGTAIDQLSRQIAANPRDARALARRAELWADDGDDDHARADLDQAIRITPDEPWLYVRRSTILLRQHRLDQALADCNTAIGLAPNDVLAYLNRAQVWESSDIYDRAGPDLDEAVRLDPTNPVAWAERSCFWLHERAPDRALSDIDEAIRLASNDASLRCWRGKCWAAKGNAEKAMAEYDDAVRLDPQHVRSLECRARAFLDRGELDRAIAEANRGIELDPKTVFFRLLRATALSAQGERARALADYDEAVRVQPTSPEIYIARGLEWEKSLHERVVGHSEKALADFDRATEVDPTYAHAYYYRAQIWHRRQAPARAVREFETLIARNPAHPLGHQGLAWTLATNSDARVRDGSRALKEAILACELTRWNDENCLDTLAAACAETGQFEAAVKWEDRAIALLSKSARPFDPLLATFGERRALYLSHWPCRD